MSESCLLVYHKNIDTIYPQQWIDEFKASILNQTCKDFDIIEMDYGGKGKRIFEDSKYYVSGVVENFVHAMILLISIARHLKYQYLLNSNCDDFYSPDRIEKQLMALREGADVVSSNFIFLNEHGHEYHWTAFDLSSIANSLRNNHNVICHPVVAFNSSFFDTEQYRPDEIPREDLLLWQRTIGTKKFVILPEFLCSHRVHLASVTNSNNR